jgi:hypothetical protein
MARSPSLSLPNPANIDKHRRSRNLPSIRRLCATANGGKRLTDWRHFSSGANNIEDEVAICAKMIRSTMGERMEVEDGEWRRKKMEYGEEDGGMSEVEFSVGISNFTVTKL